MRGRKVRLRDSARQRVDILLANSVNYAHRDIVIASRQAEIARRICLKYNLRLPYDQRRLFCRGCKQLILPGINSRVRIHNHPKSLSTTCMRCGHISRKIF